MQKSKWKISLNSSILDFYGGNLNLNLNIKYGIYSIPHEHFIYFDYLDKFMTYDIARILSSKLANKVVTFNFDATELARGLSEASTWTIRDKKLVLPTKQCPDFLTLLSLDSLSKKNISFETYKNEINYFSLLAKAVYAAKLADQEIQASSKYFNENLSFYLKNILSFGDEIVIPSDKSRWQNGFYFEVTSFLYLSQNVDQILDFFQENIQAAPRNFERAILQSSNQEKVMTFYRKCYWEKFSYYFDLGKEYE